jgi:hypothetical protein
VGEFGILEVDGLARDLEDARMRPFYFGGEHPDGDRDPSLRSG